MKYRLKETKTIVCSAPTSPVQTVSNREKAASPAVLTAEDRAGRLYLKLKPYLVVAEYNASRPQASLWVYTRCLLGPGFAPVFWSPRLRPGWRRLSFDEFRQLYNHHLNPSKAS